MKKARFFLVIVLLLSSKMLCIAETAESKQAKGGDNIWGRETLTDGLFGVNEALADNGIELSISTTQIYQQNVRGGISKHRRAGRIAGSYDVELEADFEKLFNIKGGSLYMLTEGGYSNGIDASSIGSFFGANGDAAGDRVIDVTELWYQQSMLDGALLLKFGKMDLTGGFEHHGCPVSFDCSSYANDETTQFLNGALVNNPIIPFPQYGLGVAVHYDPADIWYISAAVADAQADVRETGFKTTFHDEDYFFYIFEAGITPKLSSSNGPLQGAYRVGLWYDPQPKASTDLSKTYRDDMGFYVTFDQMLIKENSESEDSQGLGGFFRYGCADSEKNDLAKFWSIGFQYEGLFEGRDEDVLGVGYAQGVFSDKSPSTYTDDYESVFETYYNIKVTPWMNISPSVQYIMNPGGDKTISDAVVLGIRAQITL